MEIAFPGMTSVTYLIKPGEPAMNVALQQSELQGHSQPVLSQHAWKRMCGRSVSPAAIRAVLAYGRKVHVRGAAIYAIGRKEVIHHRRLGRNLSAFDGLQVVCSPEGLVITTYRNHDFNGLKH